MKPHLFPVFIAILLSMSALLRADDTPPANLGRNAALVYWVAFDQYDGLVRDEAIANAVINYPTATIDDKLRAALQSSPSLELLHIASNVEHCDWGTSVMLHKQGPWTLLPHLASTRQLARLGLLSARVNLLDKKQDHALEDLLAVHRLARHSQSGDLLINFLVGISIDAMANQFVADHLATFDEKTLRTFLEQHAKLPPMMHIETAIAGERDGFGGWLKREIVRLTDVTAIQRLMASLAGDEQRQLVRELAGKTPEEAHAMADEMFKLYNPLIKAADLPPAQFDKAHEQWEKEVKSSKNQLVRAMMPAMGSSYHTYHRSLAQTALLRAAVTYRLDGKAAFDKIKDPYGEGAFTVTEGADGIEIASKLIFREMPVKLVVKWKPTRE